MTPVFFIIVGALSCYPALRGSFQEQLSRNTIEALRTTVQNDLAAIDVTKPEINTRLLEQAVLKTAHYSQCATAPHFTGATGLPSQDWGTILAGVQALATYRHYSTLLPHEPSQSNSLATSVQTCIAVDHLESLLSPASQKYIQALRPTLYAKTMLVLRHKLATQPIHTISTQEHVQWHAWADFVASGSPRNEQDQAIIKAAQELPFYRANPTPPSLQALKAIAHELSPSSQQWLAQQNI